LGEEGNGGNPEKVAAVFFSEDRKTSALSFPQRNQNKYHADRRRNCRSGEPDGRNFGAGMKTFLQSCSKTDQKEKKTEIDQYQPDRLFVIGRDFHRREQSNTISR
jgi:hypothetical protein